MENQKLVEETIEELHLLKTFKVPVVIQYEKDYLQITMNDKLIIGIHKGSVELSKEELYKELLRACFVNFIEIRAKEFGLFNEVEVPFHKID